MRNKWWRYALAFLIAALYLSPFYILLGEAFKLSTDPSSRWVFPNYLYFGHFAKALEGQIFKGLRDSSIITVCAVVLTILVGSMAAYPLARNPSRGNKMARGFIMGVMMLPPLSVLVPIYKVLKLIQGISTYYGVIFLLVTFQLPLCIFIFSNFIQSIPSALDEAAAIDGCGHGRTFFQIILPQLAPVVASAVVFVGIGSWNDYQFSLYILQSPKIMTVTLAVSQFFAQSSSDPHAAAAAAVIGVLPIVILYICLQKYFIKGMVDSAIK